MLVPALPKPPGWLRALCSAVLVPYNNTPKLRQVSLKLLQLAANLRDWLDLEGIISYYGWPGKAPVAFTLTFDRLVLSLERFLLGPARMIQLEEISDVK